MSQDGVVEILDMTDDVAYDSNATLSRALDAKRTSWNEDGKWEPSELRSVARDALRVLSEERRLISVEFVENKPLGLSLNLSRLPTRGGGRRLVVVDEIFPAKGGPTSLLPRDELVAVGADMDPVVDVDLEGFDRLLERLKTTRPLVLFFARPPLAPPRHACSPLSAPTRRRKGQVVKAARVDDKPKARQSRICALVRIVAEHLCGCLPTCLRLLGVEHDKHMRRIGHRRVASSPLPVFSSKAVASGYFDKMPALSSSASLHSRSSSSSSIEDNIV